MILAISNRETGNTMHFRDAEQLDYYLRFMSPTKVLFVFWSWKVPDWIIKKHECYGMHTGPLLEGRGRGGDPIGNLLRRGYTTASLCVFKMTSKLDAGTVKLAIPIPIHGYIQQEIDGWVPAIKRYLEQDWKKMPKKIYREKK